MNRAIRYLRFIASALVCFFAATTLPAQQPRSTRIYIAPDDHTDYFWSATDETYRQAFLETLDYYLDQIDKTKDAPPEFQARWNCDGSLWLWEYQHHKSAAEFRRLIERVRDGHISVPMTPLALTYGAQPAEAVLRGMYYAGRLERQFDLRFPLALCIENQTLPLGVEALWAGCGAQYSWRGVCACATRLPIEAMRRRDHEIYWWTGLDGSRILMKWNSLHKNDSLGGYAEARRPREAIDYVRDDADFRRRYPFDVIGIFGQGWDDVQTLSDLFPRVARETTTRQQQVIVSNQIDFFRDFEERYGQDLPRESLSYGNEWDLLCASMAEQTARVRRAIEKLRGAEAMAVLVEAKQPGFWSSRETARQQAHLDLGLYWEHDWTADAGEPMRTQRVAWQRKLADEIDAYVDELHESARKELAAIIPREGQLTRYFVFNPLGWPRSGPADLPLPDSFAAPLHVVDAATHEPVPSQVLQRDGRQFVRTMARDVPPIGYRVLELRTGAGPAEPPAAKGEGLTLENEHLRVVATSSGALSSLFDKKSNRELSGAGGLNMLSGSPIAGHAARMAIDGAGSVSTTLAIHSPSPLPHTTRLTLYRDADWIEIENVIEANFGDVRSWNFDFGLVEPMVRHEEVGAVLTARLAPDGGHYAVRNARYDWLSLGHFVDLAGVEGGITLANSDCSFFRLGESSAAHLDTSTARISVLSGGQVDGPQLGIPHQGGDQRFVQRFSLRPGSGQWDCAAAMRWSLERQNPLIIGQVTGKRHDESYPTAVYSPLASSEPDVLLWAWKPAEERTGVEIIARAWNLADEPRTTRFSIPGLQTAMATTHLETNREQLDVSAGSVDIQFAPHQIRTVRLTIGQE